MQRLSCGTRDNLNNREGQTDSTPVDKYNCLIVLQKAFDVTLYLNQRVPV